jgi:uncharacterized protein
MADYGRWEEKRLAVMGLLLDPENPRIPPSATVPGQRELIAELIEHDDVLGLAKDIAEDGYFPVEALIGHVEDGKTYILEGNRRLASLKILHSPESAPEAKQKRVRQILGKVSAPIPDKIRVVIAPSRGAAARLIMQRHTRTQIERWAPVMQARFYRKYADEGQSVEDMAKLYGTPASEIAKFLRLDSIYKIACALKLPDDVREKVQNPRDFEPATLQRILDVPKAREVLGIGFGDDGSLTGHVTKEAFEKGFVRILSDTTRNTVNTRTLNKAEDVEKYLGQIAGDLPDIKKEKGKFTGQDFDSKATPKPAQAANNNGKKKKPKFKVSVSVIPPGIKCRVSSSRIKDIFDELHSLPLEKKPNASAVLFRILLEMSLGHYLHKTQPQLLLARAKQEGKPKDWFPPLRFLLDAILKDPALDTMNPLARKQLNRLVSASSSPLSVDGLDSYVHNKFSPPSPKDLRAYWETFEGIFEVVLEEPAPPPKGAPRPPTK